MTETLSQRLIRHEGLKLFVYDDASGFPLKTDCTIEGNPTIGVGRCLSTHGISEQEAMDMLESDINTAQAAVVNTMPWTTSLAPVRQEVLVEMAFQLGFADLMKFSLMLAALKAGDYAKAAYEMTNSDWNKQSPARCAELASLMLNGTA